MMSFTEALIQESRINPAKLYDDTAITPKKTEIRVSAHEAPATFSTEKALFNPFEITPMGERQVAASQEDLKFQLNQLLDVYDDNCLDRQTTSMSHRFGILGVISNDEPKLAKALFAARLNALKKDIDSWTMFSDRSGARSNIARLEDLLESGDLEALMVELLKYEKLHGKVPFCQVVADKFIDPDARAKTELFVPFKGNGLVNALAQTVAAYQMERELRVTATAYEEELYDDLGNLPALKANPQRPASELVKVMVLAETDTVLNYLIFQCRQDLNRVRAETADMTRPLSTAEQACFEKSAQQMQALYRLRGREDLKAFLADPANKNLNIALQQGLADRYLNQLRSKIQTTNMAGMTSEQLSDMEATMAAFEYTIANYPMIGEAAAAKTNKLANIKDDIKIFRRAAKICRFLCDEKALLTDRRMFTLKAPSSKRMAEKLQKDSSDSETQLYRALESYIDNAIAFDQAGSHEHLTKMQTARFDIRRHQQDQVEAETIAAIQGRTRDVVMTSGDYEENVAALKAIHAERQRTVPVRPVEDRVDGVYKLARNYIWRDERTLPEILADLQQLKVLKDNNYSMNSEMLEMLREMKSCDLSTLGDTARRVAAPSAEVLAEWNKGNYKTSIWKTLGLPGNTYLKLEEEARSVVTSVLKVAEQNPAQFRAFFGDVSLVIDQLKGLVGAEGAGLLAQLQHAATAHSAASLFAGDVPGLKDVTPEMARKMKRFKLLCDMAEYSLHGGVLMNAVKNIYSGYAGTVGGAIGGIVAGPIGAVIGYAAGTAFTVGNAAAQAGGTYAIRSSLNRMTGEQVRMLDKVVNYGPLFMTATSPYDLMAQNMRNFGKGDSVPTAIARSVLSPVLAPFNRMYQAIKGICHGEQGSWLDLGKEVATVCSAVALTAALGGALYATGFVAILGSPILGAAVSGILFAYGFFQMIERIRKVGGTVYATIKQYQDSLFLANSPLVARVREQCAQEARVLVKMMADHDVFHSRIQEEKVKQLHNRLWNEWAAENTAKAAKAAQAIADQLQETEKKKAREALAAQIHNAQTIVARLEEAMSKAGDIARSEQKLAALRTELQQQGLDVSRIRRAGLAQALQLLKEEQQSIIEAQCGTLQPGSGKEEIFATLTQHYREIRMGDYLIEFGSVTKEDEQAAEEAARKKVYADVEAVAARNLEDRTRLVLAQGLTKAVEAQVKSGKPLTRKAIESPEVMSAAATALENEAQLLKDALNDQSTAYSTALTQNETLSKLPEADRKGFLANSRMVFAPSWIAV